MQIGSNRILFADVAESDMPPIGLLWTDSDGAFRIQRILIGSGRASIHKEIELLKAIRKNSNSSRDALNAILDDIFTGTDSGIESRLDLSILSALQAKTLSALKRNVPRGRVASYGQLASLCGMSHGARAAGMAMASNPFPIAFPCHRVVRQGGAIGGFGGGTPLKRLLLNFEGVSEKNGAIPKESFISL